MPKVKFMLNLDAALLAPILPRVQFPRRRRLSLAVHLDAGVFQRAAAELQRRRQRDGLNVSMHDLTEDALRARYPNGEGLPERIENFQAFLEGTLAWYLDHQTDAEGEEV